VTSQAKKQNNRPSDRWQALLVKIEAHAALLVDQGNLVLKAIDGKHYWYLRFLLPADERGHRRHCSLYVGRECDLEIVPRVRALLDGYREPRRQIREVAGYVRVIKRLTRSTRATACHLEA
jgi:hypothetical protein